MKNNSKEMEEKMETLLADLTSNKIKIASKKPYLLKLEKKEEGDYVKISKEGNALSIIIGICGYLIDEAKDMDMDIDEYMLCLTLLMQSLKTKKMETK